MSTRLWMLPVLLGLGVGSCGRNRAIDINTRQVKSNPDVAVVVLGVRFAGPLPPELRAEAQVSRSDSSHAAATILIPTPPRAPGMQRPETGRAVIFQRAGEDRCFSFWDKIEVGADFNQTTTRYVVWAVPPGTYAGPPTHSATSTASAFAAQKGHIAYWGDFAIDAGWGVVRSLNTKAAEAALGLKMETPPVGATKEMSTGVVCAP